MMSICIWVINLKNSKNKLVRPVIFHFLHEIIRFYYDIDKLSWATTYPWYYSHIYKTNKINYCFANFILFSNIILINGYASHPDFPHTSEFFVKHGGDMKQGTLKRNFLLQ